ncbi:porin [Shinella sp.]|uniref:porin n=1 Tax=Shinella sp. TaxID=1870904 RepID=UPI003F6FD5E7
MNIKSLLLGSAAASMLAATGAQAADPIVYVEPEPMEYVRICDVYGAGFFYIPGTETCLQISGYVRYEIRVGGGDFADEDLWEDTYRKHLEARVNFDARNETEWGTLRSYIRIQTSGYRDNDAQLSDPSAAFDQAFIQLGGLTMGYTESYFVDGKGGIGNYGTHSMNGGFDAAAAHSGAASYGYQQRMLIAYNFAANGFFGAISLEDDANAELSGEGLDGNNYMPDVVGRLGFTQAWGGVYGVLGYDESTGEFAGRAGVEFNVAPGSSLRVYGLYASGLNAYWAQADWSVAASYQHTFSPKFFAHVGAQYWDNLNLVTSAPFTTPVTRDFIDGTSAWGVEAGVGWNVTTGFQVRAEGQYVNFDGTLGEDDGYSGRVRFIRTF